MRNREGERRGKRIRSLLPMTLSRQFRRISTLCGWARQWYAKEGRTSSRLWVVKAWRRRVQAGEEEAWVGSRTLPLPQRVHRTIGHIYAYLPTCLGTCSKRIDEKEKDRIYNKWSLAIDKMSVNVIAEHLEFCYMCIEWWSKCFYSFSHKLLGEWSAQGRCNVRIRVLQCTQSVWFMPRLTCLANTCTWVGYFNRCMSIDVIVIGFALHCCIISFINPWPNSPWLSRERNLLMIESG